MTEIDLPPPTLSADDRQRADALAEESMASPDTLFGLSFDSVNRARQFMLAVKDLSDQRRLHLVDAVLVVKGEDERVRVRETIDPQAGRSALSGAMWAGLLGLIVAGPVGWIAGLGIGAGIGVATAKVIDLGIPDEWVDWFKDTVGSDTATVLVLASDIDQRALGAEVDRFPNVRLVHTTIRTEAFAELRSAFSDRVPTRTRALDV